MRYRLVAMVGFLALLAPSAGCYRAKAPPGYVSSMGQQITTNGIPVRGACLWYKEGTGPAVAFAPSQPGQKGIDLAWVAIIRTDLAIFNSKYKVSPITESISQAKESRVTVGIRLEVDGKKFELLDKFRTDDAKKILADECLEVDGKPADVKAGRVFLIDLTTAPVSVQQCDIALNDLPAVPSGQSNLEESVRKLLDKLGERDEKVRQFAASGK